MWIAFLTPAVPATGQVDAGRIDVRIESDEARAVLVILDHRAAGHPIPDEDWAALWRSDGFTRLARRERSMGRAFDDGTFRAFVLSDSLLARRDALSQTLAAWESADLRGAAARAFAYLPAGAKLRASVYPVIKPQSNSFVFEVLSDPAIFLYVDPAQTAAQFENTLAHELHHIGYAGTCTWEPAPGDSARTEAVGWLGAFGEGLAMLAAAGGPDVHPHAASPPEDRARWDRDMKNLSSDLPALEAFFQDILDRRLTGDAVTEQAMAFFGVQGPWYTVGWAMASAVERAGGRERLLAVLCEPPAFLRAYNEAAAALNARGECLPLWSEAFLARLGG
jgi:hypothetical protein